MPVHPAVEFSQRLYQPAADTVTVMTAIKLPRRLLAQLKAAVVTGGPAIHDLVEEAGPGLLGLAGADRVAERLTRLAEDVPVMEDFVAAVRSELGNASTRPLVEALATAGIEADTLVREAKESIAGTVVDACRERRVDLLLIGSADRGRLEELLDSTRARILTNAPCDVLVIRKQAKG